MFLVFKFRIEILGKNFICVERKLPFYSVSASLSIRVVHVVCCNFVTREFFYEFFHTFEESDFERIVF